MSGCSYNLSQVREPGRAVAFPTALSWSSMVYAAKTDSGVIVVDLGFVGAGGALRRHLRELGVGPAEVTDVFLTHSHRDHIGAWREVRTARFHLAAAEEPLFEGRRTHADVPSRMAQAVTGNPAPWPGEVTVRPFSADTVFTFGRDTLRAFLVPGHTAGSAAYLFRGVLFVGDAVRRDPLFGFGGAARVFSDDRRLNQESLRALFDRALPYGVRWVCNAHAKCARPDPRFIRKVTR
ncbi:MAG TPA: MBL fold metallo-hydrolase [Longimicrobium sp.]|nr:MBL fold metallo-hydrolase [Longimicrobium sp.]